MGLTPRLKECIDFIRTHLAAHGIAPTYGEIAVALDIRSRAQVSRMMDTLVERGFATRGRGWRSVELVHSEDFHAPQCDCTGCQDRRYFKRLQLVQALQVPAPLSIVFKLSGLRAFTGLNPVRDKRKARVGQPPPKISPASSC